MRNITIHLLYIATLLLCLSSCVNSIHDEPEPITMHFSVGTAYEHIPMSATSRSISESCKRIDFYAYHEGTLKHELRQVNTDKDFGNIVHPIEQGKNEFIFIGYNSDNPLTFSTEIKTASFEKIGDTFSYCLSMDVNENTQSNQTIQLIRRVAKFELVAKDAIPENSASMDISISGGCTAINAATGAGNNAAVQQKTITIPPGNIGKMNCTFSSYMFLPAKNGIVTVNVAMKDNAGNIIAQHTFTHVEVAVNQITRYTGVLFTNDFSTDITIDNDWENVVENEF